MKNITNVVGQAIPFIKYLSSFVVERKDIEPRLELCFFHHTHYF